MKGFVDDGGGLLLSKPTLIRKIPTNPPRGYGFAVEFLIDGQWMHSEIYKTFTEANDYRRKLIEWAESN